MRARAPVLTAKPESQDCRSGLLYIERTHRRLGLVPIYTINNFFLLRSVGAFFASKNNFSFIVRAVRWIALIEPEKQSRKRRCRAKILKDI